jgi:hypothetical protein
MKLLAFRFTDGSVQFFDEHTGVLKLKEDHDPIPVFLGRTDLDIQKPKKTVVREAREQWLGEHTPGFNKHMNFELPDNAKNIKCTYEIEE